MSSSSVVPKLPPTGTYTVNRGTSFKRKKKMHIMRYDFKPASVDGSSVSDLEIRSDKSVSLLCASSTAAGGVIEFSGSRAKPAAGEEAGETCLLVFDPDTNTFTLERIDQTFHHLKQVPIESTGPPKRRRRDTPATRVRHTITHSNHTQESVHDAAVDGDEPPMKKQRPSSPQPTSTAPSSSQPPPSQPSPPPPISIDQFLPDDDDIHDDTAGSSMVEPVSGSGLDVPATAATTTAAALPRPPFPVHSSAPPPLSTPAVAVAYDFSFPTAASIRDSPPDVLPSSLVDLPSSDHQCDLCAKSIRMPPSDIELDTDTTDIDHEKESRRTYLQCSGCFINVHKQCVMDEASETDDAIRTASIQRATDRTWMCQSCK